MGNRETGKIAEGGATGEKPVATPFSLEDILIVTDLATLGAEELDPRIEALERLLKEPDEVLAKGLDAEGSAARLRRDTEEEIEHLKWMRGVAPNVLEGFRRVCKYLLETAQIAARAADAGGCGKAGAETDKKDAWSATQP